MYSLSGELVSLCVDLRVKPICHACLSNLSVKPISLSVKPIYLSSLSVKSISLSVKSVSLSVKPVCQGYQSVKPVLQACLFICVSACGVCQSTVCQACLSRLTVCQACLPCKLVCLSVCLPVVPVSHSVDQIARGQRGKLTRPYWNFWLKVQFFCRSACSHQLYGDLNIAEHLPDC